MIDGTAELPETTSSQPLQAISDPAFMPDAAAFGRGAVLFGIRCVVCPGMEAIAAGLAPDLRASQTIVTPDVFGAIVNDGMLVDMGMPRFENLSDRQLTDIRHYLRSRGQDLAAGRP